MGSIYFALSYLRKVQRELLLVYTSEDPALTYSENDETVCLCESLGTYGMGNHFKWHNFVNPFHRNLHGLYKLALKLKCNQLAFKVISEEYTD